MIAPADSRRVARPRTASPLLAEAAGVSRMPTLSHELPQPEIDEPPPPHDPPPPVEDPPGREEPPADEPPPGPDEADAPVRDPPVPDQPERKDAN